MPYPLPRNIIPNNLTNGQIRSRFEELENENANLQAENDRLTNLHETTEIISPGVREKRIRKKSAPTSITIAHHGN